MTAPTLRRATVFWSTTFLLLLCAYCARGAEAWSDPTLSFTNGLQLWLDASRQSAARQSAGQRLPLDGMFLDEWLDGSGRGRNLFQVQKDARPQFRSGGGVAWFSFDGQNDFLSASRPPFQFTNATVFLVAAPRGNSGGFRALLSTAHDAQNDYRSGLNIDLGPLATSNFDTLNVESAGTAGAANLLHDSSAFGRFHIISVSFANGTNGISVRLNGQTQRQRQQTTSSIHADHVLVGGRFYSNDDQLPFAQGFFEGDIAEILLYDRELSEAETGSITDYLLKKYEFLRSDKLGSTGFNPLIPVARPPPVQMFLPGFSVRELPVVLPNINCVKYREDGKLVALGYNGQIHLLSDTDGDGLEDRIEPFWAANSLRAPIGMALTPPGYAKGQGVFVAAKGKVSLIVDTNGDDRADSEIIVAEGWKELSHGVDALGVAIDREGQVFFGLGTANFTNPYLVDAASGEAHYDLKSERGTILKVSADFQHRETVCTGIRFPVALAFNSAGDLFCTDQEGATWLANGNPLDELLHIQPGRHYGFPPRHPRFLPGVIDEPSTFDYAPQHQSTCGLNFNGTQNGKIFGPDWWRGDAFVTGYSRGKLYRTKLVETPAGYVAANQLIGCLNMLTVDACVSPRGELVVATHSGQPDWGSGPNGIGKLYKVSYTGRELPQPVSVWAESPTETCVAWDRPLTLDEARTLAKQCSIAAGKYIAAGDRFESLRPGYQVVQDQLRSARSILPVLSTRLSPDRRVLSLLTEPRVQPLNYGLTLHTASTTSASETTQTNQRSQTATALSQHATIDLAYSLTGVQTVWTALGETNAHINWLPSIGLEVSRNLLQAVHRDEFPVLHATPGTLVLRTQLNLLQMLRPAVQPGAKIDYSWPEECVFIHLRADTPFSMVSENISSRARATSDHHYEMTITNIPVEDQWFPLELSLETRNREPSLSVTWSTAEDTRERPLALHRQFLPWVLADTANASPPSRSVPPELSGANWLNGRRVFFGESAGCSRCHQIRGEGYKVGPDLSNLVQRDYASVLRDIVEPNAALNPDHVAYAVQLKEGELISGVLQEEDEKTIVIAVPAGPSRKILKANIESITPSSVSLMPEGLRAAIGEPALKDLMAFLLTSPLGTAALQTVCPVSPRSRADWVALSPTNAPGAARKPFHILLLAGPKDHGPDEHDYPLWQQRWATLLALAENVKVSTAFSWPSEEEIRIADVIVSYSNNPGWSKERAEKLKAFQDRGGGLVFLHYAVDGHDAVEALSGLIGLAWKGGQSKFRHGPLELAFHRAEHPITRGLTQLHLHDESYWNLLGNSGEIDPLASGIEEGAPQPLMWTRENGVGRVFVSIPGHYTWTFDDPLFRLILLRAICWVGHEPEDRLSELAFVGARIRD